MVFDEYGDYYDLLYQNKDYVGESAYIHTLLKENGCNDGELLELGSGTGRHAYCLATHGYLVRGIELSQRMLLKSPSHENLSFSQGDICNFDLHKKYDAVYSVFHVFSYLTANADINNALRNVSKHLKFGGIFIFDFWYDYAVISCPPQTKIKIINADGCKLTRISEPSMFPEKNQVRVDFSLLVENLAGSDSKWVYESHYMRYFSLLEIENIAANFGLTIIKAEEFQTGNSLGRDTWGACVVMRQDRDE